MGLITSTWTSLLAHSCRQRKQRIDCEIKKTCNGFSILIFFKKSVKHVQHVWRHSHLDELENEQLDWLITSCECVSVLHTATIIVISITFIAIEWVWIDKVEKKILFFYIHMMTPHTSYTMERHNLTAIKFAGIKAVFPQWHLHLKIFNLLIMILAHTHTWGQWKSELHEEWRIT